MSKQSTSVMWFDAFFKLLREKEKGPKRREEQKKRPIFSKIFSKSKIETQKHCGATDLTKRACAF